MPRKRPDDDRPPISDLFRAAGCGWILNLVQVLAWLALPAVGYLLVTHALGLIISQLGK